MHTIIELCIYLKFGYNSQCPRLHVITLVVSWKNQNLRIREIRRGNQE